MLNLIIGRENLDLDKVRMNSRLYFTRYKKPEWFETDFAKRVIKTVDKADVIFEEALKNRFGHGMSTEQLSTGTKTLLLMKFEPDHIYYGTNMGDNCVPFIMELVNESDKDVTLLLEHFMDFPYEYEGMLKMDGVPISIDDYESAIAYWSEHYDLKEEYEREWYFNRDFPKELCWDFREIARKEEQDARNKC